MTDEQMEPGFYWVKLKEWKDYKMCELTDPTIIYGQPCPFKIVSELAVFGWDSIESISVRIEPPKI